MLPCVLNHEVSTSLCVDCSADMCPFRAWRCVHKVDDRITAFLDVNHARSAESPSVSWLSAATRKKTRAIEHHLMQLARCLVLSDCGFELQEGRVIVEEFFRHIYGVSAFRLP